MQYSVPFRVTAVSKAGLITHVLVEATNPDDAIEAARDLARMLGVEPRDLLLEHPQRPRLTIPK